MNTKKLTVLSLLISIALIIYIIEAQLPPLTPVPGIKMGLSNIITLITMVWLGKKEAFTVLILRIVIGSIFAGLMISFVYSLSGGILCFLIMALLINILKKGQIWVVSILGAIAHNAGQIFAAIFMTSTWQVIYYFPILVISAVITGAFTGFVVLFLIKHTKLSSLI